MTTHEISNELTSRDALVLGELVATMAAIAMDEAAAPAARERGREGVAVLRKVLAIFTRDRSPTERAKTVAVGGSADASAPHAWLSVDTMIVDEHHDGFVFDRGVLAGLRLSIGFPGELPSIWVARSSSDGALFLRSWLEELNGDVMLPPGARIVGVYRPAVIPPIGCAGPFDWIAEPSSN